MIEKDQIYESEIEVSTLNEDNLLKPYGYLNLFAQIAEKHLSKINVNIDSTMQYNLAWVLISLSVEIIKPIEGCGKIFANTWYSQKQGPFYRREFVFKNEYGELMFHGTTFSVLLDMEKRTIHRGKDLPFVLSEPSPFFTIDAKPTFRTTLDFEKIDERRIYNSYIDCLGHVNNCRYGEFVYDAFIDTEREKLSTLKRMEFYFISELIIKDSLSILKAYDKDKVLIRGYNNTKETTAFDAILKF